MPSDAAAQSLRDVVGALARAYDAPVFEPHMTLIGDLQGPPDRTHDACVQVMQGAGAIDARISGIATSPAYFMSLFADLSLSVDLMPARHRLSQLLRGRDAPDFRPHLSLAYGLTEAQRARAESRDFGHKDLVFKRLAVVHSAKSVPIADWSILSEITL